jgi:cell division protein FtsL
MFKTSVFMQQQEEQWQNKKSIAKWNQLITVQATEWKQKRLESQFSSMAGNFEVSSSSLQRLWGNS